MYGSEPALSPEASEILFLLCLCFIMTLLVAFRGMIRNKVEEKRIKKGIEAEQEILDRLKRQGQYIEH
jgi:hypothetical protein